MKSMRNGLNEVRTFRSINSNDILRISIGMYSGGSTSDLTLDKPEVLKIEGEMYYKKQAELEEMLTKAVIEILKEADEKILNKVNEIVANFK
jgi:acyl-CoA-binding protein